MKNVDDYQEISGQSEIRLVEDSEHPFDWSGMLPGQRQESVSSDSEQDFQIALSNASPTVVVSS